MKITYSILYKNGHEDVIDQPVNESDIETIKTVNECIQEALREDAPWEVTLGEVGKQITTIRLSEVVRVKFNFDRGN